MSNEINHGNAGNGDFEHQDLQPKGVIYFLIALGVAIILSIFLLRGVYTYLDNRENASQPPVNPLVTNVPKDTRHIAPGYPQSTFPNPKLEEDERGQLNGFLMSEEDQLYSYGWVDEKAGVVHIPIERAMDLIVERGLPTRPQGAAAQSTTGHGGNKKTGKGTASK